MKENIQLSRDKKINNIIDPILMAEFEKRIKIFKKSPKEKYLKYISQSVQEFKSDILGWGKLWLTDDEQIKVNNFAKEKSLFNIVVRKGFNNLTSDEKEIFENYYYKEIELEKEDIQLERKARIKRIEDEYKLGEIK